MGYNLPMFRTDSSPICKKLCFLYELEESNFFTLTPSHQWMDPHLQILTLPETKQFHL